MQTRGPRGIERRVLHDTVVLIGPDAVTLAAAMRAERGAGRRVLAYVGRPTDPELDLMLRDLVGRGHPRT